MVIKRKTSTLIRWTLIAHVHVHFSSKMRDKLGMATD
jgi:hypothetical protein